MDETFLVLSFMALSSEIYKTFHQHKFFHKLFLPPKLKNEKKYFCIGILRS